MLLSRRLGVPALVSAVALCTVAFAPLRAAAASGPSLTQAHNLSVSGTVLCTEGGEFLQPFSGAAVGDLFGDGQEEIVAAFSDGQVYVWYASNYQVVPGWPKQVADGVAASPTIAVLDGDTLPSIIVADWSGTVNVWDGHGNERPGWPQHSLYSRPGVGAGFFSSVAVGDLYGDGRQELFASALDLHTYAWFSNGTAVPGWPQTIYDSSLATPALADLQHNGTLDVVTPSDASGFYGVYGGIYWVWEPDGQQYWHAAVNEVPWSSPAITDFGDGIDVVVNGTGHYYSQTTGEPVGRYIVGYNQNGSTRPGYPVTTDDVSFASPAVGDLLGNGGREVVELTENGMLYAVDGNGNVLSGFPFTLPNGDDFSAGPAIAPVDSTGRNGIYVPSGSELLVYSMAALGSPAVESIPGGAPSYSTPTIANLGNGSLSVILTSASGNYACGATDTYNVTVWTVNGTTPSQLNGSSWPTFHGNMDRSGSNIAVLPDPPTDVTATLTGSNQATITWVPPTDVSTEGITGYEVTLDNALGQAIGTPQSVPGALSPCDTTFGSLPYGAPIYFSVASVNSVGTGRGGESTSLTPLSGVSPAAGTTAVSTKQYQLPNSDGVTWQVMDETDLAFTMTPSSSENVLLSANSDLWTAATGYNQDLGILVTPSGGSPALAAWKESGGFAGTYSPNAAFVETVYAMTGGTTYTVQVVWKTNKAAIGATIAAGAGSSPNFSPTRLTADVLPAGSQSAVSTQQYTLPNSNGSSWAPMDATNLKVTLSGASGEDAVVSGNSDLWTANAGYNQDLGIFVSVNGGTATLVAWKESGGFAGTFSPNAAYVQTVCPMTAGDTYVFSLEWKTNKAAPGATIEAGAGTSPTFSPTRLTAYEVASASMATAVSTQQYLLPNSNGSIWSPMDATNLSTSVTGSAETVLVSGNADLWTANGGYNQDLGIFVSVDGGTATLLAWKESGGFAGTYSPNAAYVQTVYTMSSGHTYVFSLEWKTNIPASGATIDAGAGSAPTFSPTRLTVVPQT
ncbi:MAG: fibronectin type III domain-containing protein [Candidatus Dormibacteria bacterium]|jgi:hypothetical protein